MTTRSRLFLASLVVSLLAGFLLIPLPASHAQNQNEWAPGKYMTEATGRVMSSVRTISDITDFGYSEGVCFMAALLRPQQTGNFSKYLKGGTEYIILGGGDDDVEDLDIRILDDNNQTIAKDERVDAAPVVRFRAPRDGWYTLQLILYKARNPSFCCAAILRKNGYDVPKPNLVAASAKLIAYCNIVDRITPRNVGYMDGDNVWCMYGTILKPGTSTTISNLKLGTGDRVLVAAGDNNATNLDLDLFDSQNRLLKQDREPDAHPFIIWPARADERYVLRVWNTAARGPTLVLYAALQLR